MKKSLIVPFGILLLAALIGLSATQADAKLSHGITADQTESILVQVGPGQETYYTHPEFTGIMTRTVTVPAQNTEPGYIFIGAIPQFYDGPGAAMILEDDGEPLYIKLTPEDHFVGETKALTVNGEQFFTYHSGTLPGNWTYGSTYVLDTSYQLVDTWTIDNGYGSDVHDFYLMNNGNAMLMAYEPIPFDFSPYGGPANGTLIDILLQEQDPQKNVLFEWRASEHLPIDDTEENLNSTDPVDFLHTNGLTLDHDGNWLISSRNFSEITKINRQTGEVMWRMGGKGNQFTFTNDEGFFNQHNIIRLANGNITLFDNGTFHNPPHSRAVEYAVDEVNMTVTRVWQYPEDTSEYSPFMSNVQRLPGGNTMIGWGTQGKLSEVSEDGDVLLEILLGTFTSRALRIPWSATPAHPPRAILQHDADPTAVTIYTSWNGATEIVSYDVYAGPTSTSLVNVGNVGRSGFETEIMLSGLPDDTCFFRVQPVHAEANPTPFSNLLYRLDLPVCQAQISLSNLPVVLNP